MDNITQYRSLGWDFNMTIWGHENSALFWDYIERNPHNQTHHIVTFRTGRLFDHIWHDLAKANCPLLPFHFRSVHGIPEKIYTAFVGELGKLPPSLTFSDICRRCGNTITVE